MPINLTRRETLAALLATGASAVALDAGVAEPSTRVSFLVVSDVYRMSENKDGRGGLARLASVIALERAKAAAKTAGSFASMPGILCRRA